MRNAAVRSSLLLGVAFAGVATTNSAQAQSSAEDSTADIIVTARRTEERLQDVPISITVYNQQQLDRRNIVVAADLATYTPSLSVNQRYGPEKSSFAIRGFNQDQSTAPTVGVYFADVVGVRAQGGTTSGNTVGAGAFMDLQNVQVLKGPQGTLFGRNTTGGAVLLVPSRPTGELEGYFEGTIGNYDMLRGVAVINVPVSETLKIRGAIDRNKRDGYMKNHSGIGPKDYSDVDYFAARLSVLADLTPNLENYTIASYSNSFANGYAARLVACERTLDPTSPQFQPALAVMPQNFRRLVTSGPACDQLARQNARGDGILDVEVSNPDPYIKLEQWQIINTTTWQASDHFRIKNIISYGQFRERASFSLNSENLFGKLGSGLAPGSPSIGRPFVPILLNPAGSDDNAQQSTFTEELQLQGDIGDNRLTWQAGAYYELSKPLGWSHGYTAQFLDCQNIQTFQCAGLFAINPGNISDSKTKLNFRNIGLYAQATFNITEWIALTGGFRYTMDRIKGQNESTRVLFATLPGSGATGRVCNDSFRFNRPDGPDPDTNPDTLPVTDGSQCHFEINVKSEKPTWLIDVDIKPTDDILLYAKYSRGYRQGGLSFTNVGRETWEPEKVDAYEIGAKATFRAGQMNGYFNVAGFYNDFTDQQIFSTAIANPASGIAGGAVILNAGKSRIKGIEVDSSVTFFDSLRFDLGYTYLDTLVKEIVAPPAQYPFVRFIPTVVAGGPLTLSPKHRVTLSAAYTLPLDESIGRITFGGTYVYTAKQLSNSGITAPTDPLSPYHAANMGILPSTNLFNLNLNWDSILDSSFDAAFFMTNVTNEHYPIQISGGFTSSGYENVLIGQPRMYGFRLKYRFGDDSEAAAPPPPAPAAPPPPAMQTCPDGSTIAADSVCPSPAPPPPPAPDAGMKAGERG